MGTDYAEINYGFKWKSCVYGGPAQMVDFPVVVSQTLKPGCAVCKSFTSGSIRVAVEADTSLFGVATHNLVTSSSEGEERATIIPFLPGYIWEVRGSFDLVGGAPPATMGRELDLAVPTTSRHRIDTAGATVQFLQVGFHPDDVSSTGQGNRLWVTIRPTITSYGEMEGVTS